MQFIDTHCHLDDERYTHDIDKVLENASKLGVTHCIIPAANPNTLERAKMLANTYNGVYFACGLHPCDIEHENATSMDYLAFLNDKKCVAIGECGLDYYHLDSSKDIVAQKQRQKEVFIAQIERAINAKLPLIIHIREASQDAYEILTSFPQAYGVLHCYNADQILLKLSDRFYYGIGGVATFKNARRLIEVLPRIPISRIVFETDAPYLTPHPHRGTRNSPEYIPLIAHRVAEVLGVDLSHLAETTTQNAKKLFCLG